ncbi:sensor histidine kinase [Streptomyces alkaliterrae]|uniref:histidine kinase n=1 Tax=Streptomyces alkaliterrae TaxID=2213162 RepID=A0A5P0YRU4_9ACTN|nr:histidine kinase [Streptomyces alkaliterrae]MBB1253568.1 two-component sensor histidine kinase [Streptomyces alkaliterrae]MBB1258976.1 two-component sensor histidine kinase [Streptomyces alkaliterrae]MQS03051.1 two-component sensor histidine kinase [Streptomyces alkaliterrae]
MIRLSDVRKGRPGRFLGRRLLTLSPRTENLLVLCPSALELLTILSFASAWEIATHTATVAALLLRRRWPFVVLLLTLPVAFSGYLLIAPMAALYQVAKDVPNPRLVAFGALLLFAAGLGPWLPTAEEPFSYEDGLFGLLSAAMLSAGPTAVGRLLRTRGELSERLADLARTQERERQLLAERAVAEERARLAREMHDVVSHKVSMICVQAGALQVTTAEPNSREIAGTVRRLSVDTLEELRHLVGVLRSAREEPGLADVAALVETSGLDARLETDVPVGDRGRGAGDADSGTDDSGAGAVGAGAVGARGARGCCWSADVQRAAYRTVQEALTNVRKYAPESTVVVRLDVVEHGGESAGALRVEVRNSAPACPSSADRRSGLPTGGHGLTGLRERAELLGGRLDAGPAEDGGFRVAAVLPAGGRQSRAVDVVNPGSA